MKALLQTGSSGRVPVPPEKRFLIDNEDVFWASVNIGAIRRPSRMVVISEMGAYWPGWVQAPRHTPEELLWNGNEQKFNIAYADGHAKLTLVETGVGWNQEYSFYVDE